LSIGSPLILQRSLIAFIVPAALAGASSCGRSDAAQSTSVTNIKAEYDSMGTLRRLDYDRNGNGRTDTVAYMDGTRIVRIEIDADENGLVDRWEYYTNQQLEKVGSSSANDGVVDTWAFPRSDGKLWKIELSTLRNGQVNRTEFYEAAMLAAAEEDSDGDGRVDKWESYKDGTLTKVAFDTNGRGKPNRQVVYRNGDAVVEVDPEGTGTFRALISSDRAGQP